MKSKQLSLLPMLPNFIPSDAWEAFLAMRKSQKKPATEYAQNLIIKKLAFFRDAGYDIKEILDASIINGWLDVYPPKENVKITRSYQSSAEKHIEIANALTGRFSKRTNDE